MQSNYVMTAKSLLTQIGSLAAATMVARSIINDFLPCEIRDYLSSTFHSIFIRKFSSEIVMIIEEFDGLETNHIFESAELYIGARTTTSSSSATRFKVRKSEANKQIHVNLDQNEEVIDDFQGTNFRWVLHCHRVESYTTMKSEVRTFHLKFHKKFKNLALEKYLPHIVMEAELLKQKTKTIKLYTADAYGSWDDSIHLNHPSTFETLAMDTELKTIIIEDLERFKRRKEYYQRVGKAWKRGYLLYGPPGTGKSSLIAAMANYLNFDIYDLELNGLRSDLDLRRALVGTANKSIVVVEDIDCSVQFHDRDKPDDDVGGDNLGQQKKDKITLSGLLNFIDGLWSSCGDERIIIFTTNHKGKLDPALLRPGRMDLHIHMSYCTPCGFKLLANNYLGIKHHLLFQDIERLIEEALVTPAEVAEQLMRHDKADVALAGLVEFLNIKVDNAKNKATSESMFKEINDGSKDDVQVV